MEDDSIADRRGRWTCYSDDGSLVIVDVMNPGAWIRSDVTVPLADPTADAKSGSTPPV